MDTLLRGTRGSYSRHALIARTGMAEVWLASGGGRAGPLEVKQLLPALAEEEDFLEMFLDEAQLTARFDFPGVSPALDWGRGFLVTEHVPGVRLEALKDRAPLPIPIVCALFAQWAATLARVHALQADGRPANVIHRDLCPETLFLAFDGTTRITDFTLSNHGLRSSESRPGIIKGRFAYMSPEAVRGLSLDARSDVFSLAVSLWECLAGQRLFLGQSDFASLEKVRKAEVPPLPMRVPTELQQVVRTALEREKEDRPGADAFSAALATFAAGVSTSMLSALWHQQLAAEVAEQEARAGKVPVAGLDALIRGISK